ncbi:MAG: hypothetical protein IKH97_09060 [Bacteroidales bacterium]|nr:hypothetical protein [Bacteroidales bacterium]
MKRNSTIAWMLVTAMAVFFAAGCTEKPDNPENPGGETPEEPTVPIGAVDGLFTINEQGGKVYFSKGNLQYQASTKTWRFAEHQWDQVGGKYGMNDNARYWGNVPESDNTLASADYSGWQDLFSWGTSGWSGGVSACQPYEILTDFEVDKYYILGGDASNGLVGQYANADWGVYNAISNGGNKAGMWRTLTSDEWVYVFERRSGSRFCKAQVEGANGMILLPDGWDNTAYTLKNINRANGSWTDNTLDASTWTNQLEPAGAVFLPTTGKRTIANMNSYWDIHLDLDEGYGLYWSTTPKVLSYATYVAYQYNFHKSNANLDTGVRSQGLAVRLVQDSNEN